MSDDRVKFPHLSDKAFEALSLPKEERIKYIKKDRWISYPAAAAIMSQLQEFITKDKTVRNPGISRAASPIR